MGINTIFEGEFTLDRLLAPHHYHYLRQFNISRRMKRSIFLLHGQPDPMREAVGLPLGPEGAYCVYFRPWGFHEVTYRADPAFRDVLDFNEPPQGQPGLWCGWQPNLAGSAIVWDQREKFYHYVEWLRYLIQHFLAPWGYRLNGKVKWDSEDPYTPRGEIIVADNMIKVNDLGRLN